MKDELRGIFSFSTRVPISHFSFFRCAWKFPQIASGFHRLLSTRFLTLAFHCFQGSRMVWQREPRTQAMCLPSVMWDAVFLELLLRAQSACKPWVNALKSPYCQHIGKGWWWILWAKPPKHSSWQGEDLRSHWSNPVDWRLHASGFILDRISKERKIFLEMECLNNKLFKYQSCSNHFFWTLNRTGGNFLGRRSF